MSRIVLTAASRVGCVRSNNEDMVLAFDKLLRSDIYTTEFLTENTDRFIIAVADGMGGHNAGEVASFDALSNLQFFLNDIPAKLTSVEFKETMDEWLNSVNHTINAKGRVNKDMVDMGTTLVGVLYYNQKYYWINCGDSRVYRFRNGQLTQLSTDHSLNNLNGEKRHSNLITNCIGAGCRNSYMDMVDITDDFQSGDTYMLCSDGLNDMVDDEKISSLLADGANANQLCEAAIVAGGYDNVSVCVFNVE